MRRQCARFHYFIFYSALIILLRNSSLRNSIIIGSISYSFVFYRDHYFVVFLFHYISVSIRWRWKKTSRLPGLFRIICIKSILHKKKGTRDDCRIDIPFFILLFFALLSVIYHVERELYDGSQYCPLRIRSCALCRRERMTAGCGSWGPGGAKPRNNSRLRRPTAHRNGCWKLILLFV